MRYKVLSSIAFALLFFSVSAIAQEQLSNEEVQSFYGLIRHTKEYKAVMRQVDSANNAAGTNEVPEEIKMEIIKKDRNAAEFIFYAYLERRLAIGLSLDRYDFQYDKRKKQIVSIEHRKSKYQIE